MAKTSSGVSASYEFVLYYRIEVIGHIPEEWRNRLGGLCVSQEQRVNGLVVTTLEGELEHQAALAGVYDTLDKLSLCVLLTRGCYPREEAGEHGKRLPITLSD